MKPYRYFKTAAKFALSGRLLKCIVAFLFVTLLPKLIFLLSAKFSLPRAYVIIILCVTAFILVPCFKMGAIGFLYDSLRKKEITLGNMFDGFLYILKLIPLTLLKIIPYIPFVAIAYFSYRLISPDTFEILKTYSEDPYNNIMLLNKISDNDFYIMFVAEMSLIITLIVAAIINSYLALTEYILYNEKLSGIKSIIKSIKLMKGHIIYYIKFNLSFILWYVASAFTGGYSDLYLTPYKEASKIMFYNYLRYINGECEPAEIPAEEDEPLKEE